MRNFEKENSARESYRKKRTKQKEDFVVEKLQNIVLHNYRRRSRKLRHKPLLQCCSSFKIKLLYLLFLRLQIHAFIAIS